MPADWQPAVPFDRCFDALYGLEVASDGIEDDGLLRGRVAVTDAILNHAGVVHGGVFAAAAEALASRGTALVVLSQDRLAVGLSNDTRVLDAPATGILRFEARVRDRGDDAWVWIVDARSEDGALCATSTVTVAVRG